MENQHRVRPSASCDGKLAVRPSSSSDGNPAHSQTRHKLDKWTRRWRKPHDKPLWSDPRRYLCNCAVLTPACSWGLYSFISLSSNDGGLFPNAENKKRRRGEGWGVVSFADCPQGMMACLGPCDCNVSMYNISVSDGKCLFSVEGLSFCV